MKIDEDDGQRRIMVCYGAHPYALFSSIEEEIRDCLKTLVTCTLDLNIKFSRRSPTATMYSSIG